MSMRQDRPRVVIVGAGFGGLSAAKALAGSPFEVVLIDRQNYHLFQPLLYQVATAGLSPADIAAPIRAIFAGQKNTTVLLGSVQEVCPARREVIAGDRRIPYDYLVIATGAQHTYFGHEEWASFAPGLKTVDDATRLRAKILLAFERAESEQDELKRRRWLNFVVIGGGPTGVELAGAIAELAKRALAKDFRTIDPRCARIVLVEAGPRILPTFDASLSLEAQKGLERLGAEIRLGQPVTQCDSGGVQIGQEFIPAATVIWAAGVKASPAGDWLGVPTDRAGRVVVGPDFSVPGYPEVFVIGDTASAMDLNGKLLPGVAPVAKQQGQHVAGLLLARLRGASEPRFRYRDFGSLATIGRKLAVAEIGGVRLSGFAAWLLWSVAHVYFLIGFRNRTVVALTWLWSYLTFERGTRLITGIPEEGRPSLPSTVAPGRNPLPSSAAPLAEHNGLRSTAA